MVIPSLFQRGFLLLLPVCISVRKIEHGCPPVWRDNPRALASGFSTIQADKSCYILLVARYPVYTLHFAGYLVLMI